MPTSISNFKISLKKGVALIEPPGGGVLVLQTATQRVTLKPATASLRAILTTLAAEATTTEQLEQLAQAIDGQPGLAGLQKLLPQLFTRGLLCRSVWLDDQLLAMAVPLTAHNGFLAGEMAPDQLYVLSRFVYGHAVGGQMTLESPRSPAQVLLYHPLAATLVAVLVRPQRSAELAIQLPNLPADVVKLLLNLLLKTNMLAEFQENGVTQEDENPALAQWEFHDLLFHSRSRRGRHARPSGNTMRFKDRIEPLPALKPDMSAEIIPLYRPSLDAIMAADAPFTQVLEQRRSSRAFGDPPIKVEQLGEFLYRSARVRSIAQTELGELSSRPYPSGGAMYELELYVAVDKCVGLDRGLYHYQPQAHQLHTLVAKASEIETLLHDAAHSMSQPARPHVLIIIAARFQRVAWKYETLAYALILKNVGVLQQTMSLVATAMGLAACALGNGNSDLFACAAGTDYYVETSVGELALGSMPDSIPDWTTANVESAQS
jgi:oxazoline/thiazoline dehydrogenase